MNIAVLALFALTLAPHAGAAPVRGLAKLGVTFAYDGINCWGTALYAAGLKDRYQYAGDREYTATLENPAICRRLRNGEKVRPGMLGAVRRATDGGFEELHGFVVLGGDEILTTKDFTYETGMQRRSLARDFQLFAEARNQTPACLPRAHRGIYRQSPRACSDWIDFYACRPGQTLRKQILSAEARPLLRRIEAFTAELERHLVAGKPVPEARSVSFLEEMNQVMTRVFELPEGRERAALTALYESMAYQFTSIYNEQKTKSELAD